MLDFFANTEPWQIPLSSGATVLHRCALSMTPRLFEGITRVTVQAPFRHMVTPSGYMMSVAMTNCGALGWISNENGYLYSPFDPLSGSRWPPMPKEFAAFCYEVAVVTDYPNFKPDNCLISRYSPGAKISLHQDKNEPNLRAPIISIALGLPAVFQFGGAQRSDPLKRLILEHGDVVVFGGNSRLFYHGIQPIKPGVHPEAGEYHYDITFRQASAMN